MRVGCGKYVYKHKHIQCIVHRAAFDKSHVRHIILRQVRRVDSVNINTRCRPDIEFLVGYRMVVFLNAFVPRRSRQKPRIRNSSLAIEWCSEEAYSYRAAVDKSHVGRRILPQVRLADSVKTNVEKNNRLDTKFFNARLTPRAL